MKSNFSIFLKEGAIKLPKTLRDDVVAFGVYWFLAVCKDFAENNFTELQYSQVVALINKRAVEHNVGEIKDSDAELAGKKFDHPSFKAKTFKLNLEELPSSYTKKIDTDELKSKSMPIKISVWFNVPKVLGHNSYGHYDHEKDLLVISLPQFIRMPKLNLSTVDGVKKMLGAVLDNFVGTIEHELTHAIQLKFLGKIDKKQIAYKSSDPGSEEYYLDQIEFDPQIKSQFKIFKSTIDSLKERKSKLLPEAIAYFVGSSNTKYGSFEQSVFFLALKKNDEPQWKKACKIFVQLAKDYYEK